MITFTLGDDGRTVTPSPAIPDQVGNPAGNPAVRRSRKVFRCNSSVVARGLADSARADAAAGACGLARADANFAAAARDNVARARDIAEAANAYEL
ncbi:hypothetical protein ABZ552_30405 [Nocardia sp. NPDC019219]|uniref:hypothetical protein n=1 Tax=Nocardia sp. NPDC019219 TaxID=3154590 RepID=UPI0033EE410F